MSKERRDVLKLRRKFKVLPSALLLHSMKQYDLDELNEDYIQAGTYTYIITKQH